MGYKWYSLPLLILLCKLFDSFKSRIPVNVEHWSYSISYIYLRVRPYKRYRSIREKFGSDLARVSRVAPQYAQRSPRGASRARVHILDISQGERAEPASLERLVDVVARKGESGLFPSIVEGTASPATKGTRSASRCCSDRAHEPFEPLLDRDQRDYLSRAGHQSHHSGTGSYTHAY